MDTWEPHESDENAKAHKIRQDYPGVLFGYIDSSSFYVVWIDRSAAKIALQKVTGGITGSALASANYTAADSTWYKIKIVRWLKYVDKVS